ncbi:MAG: HNH endonuclease [Moraxellaceae bacterium]|nr:HNH endonuclease [Moraxellaceae bacterium]
MPKWTRMFDEYGIKQVTETDKNKSAYVLSKSQHIAIRGAGVQPEVGRAFTVTVLFDDDISVVDASFYYSVRQGAGRRPEPRMGLAFISEWLQTNDRLCLGRIGTQLFAAKLGAAPADADLAAQAIVDGAHSDSVFQNAELAVGQPARRTAQTLVYARNPWVIRAAILRSKGACEMPDCQRALFLRDDGSVYLEVHHVTPLGESGDDTLENVAALCPSCHRELHFGSSRHEMRQVLRAYVSSRFV